MTGKTNWHHKACCFNSTC